MNTLEFIEHNTGLFIFIIAMTILLAAISGTTNYIHAVSDEILDDNVIYEVKDYDEDMVIESRDIIALLIKKLDYDIKINSVEIHKDSFNYRTFDYSLIKGSYRKFYELDEKGSIKCIVFKSLTSTQ